MKAKKRGRWTVLELYENKWFESFIDAAKSRIECLKFIREVRAEGHRGDMAIAEVFRDQRRGKGVRRER